MDGKPVRSSRPRAPPLARRLTLTRQYCRVIRPRIRPRHACQREVG
ncbi:hypothetical protein MYVA_2944 [Mycolicibacterium vaccae 95051]|nr:hypothetical protein MYVA_2944 [Mycolicibacterium vaccae 95051]